MVGLFWYYSYAFSVFEACEICIHIIERFQKVGRFIVALAADSTTTTKVTSRY